jgi:hypothetical protein
VGEGRKAHFRVRQVSVEDEIKRLERYVQRMERRYECPSDVAMQAVKWGRMKETADVALWLINYQDLLDLREALDQDSDPGTRTKTTERSS